MTKNPRKSGCNPPGAHHSRRRGRRRGAVGARGDHRGRGDDAGGRVRRGRAGRGHVHRLRGHPEGRTARDLQTGSRQSRGRLGRRRVQSRFRRGAVLGGPLLVPSPCRSGSLRHQAQVRDPSATGSERRLSQEGLLLMGIRSAGHGIPAAPAGVGPTRASSTCGSSSSPAPRPSRSSTATS